MIDIPAAPLFPLRINFKNKRRYSDKNFIQIDEAIDAVGKGLFPNRWGMSDIWKEAPFVYLPKTHRLKRLKFHPSRKLGKISFGGIYFRDECQAGRSEAQSASDDIKNAYQLLRRAIENGSVRCFKNTKTSVILPFKKGDFERLRRQQDVALYSGRLKGPKNSVHIIQVQQDSLHEWIRHGCRSERLIDAPTGLYQKIAALIKSSTDFPRTMSRNSLKTYIRSKLCLNGYKISNNRFDDILWREVPETYKKPGRKGGQVDSEETLFWMLFGSRLQESVEFYRKRSQREGD